MTTRFYQLLRDGYFIVSYDIDYNPEWTDKEISAHIVKLACYGNKLTALPLLPQCTELDCYDNQLINLPALPQCVRLSCHRNQLTALPKLPKCVELYCQRNQ